MDFTRAITGSLVATSVALLALAAPAAEAQERRPDLRMERSPAPIPLVSPDAQKSTEKDVERAREELRVQKRTDAIIRDNVKTVPNRPDLGQDVTGGVQSRAIHDALRPR